MMYPEGDIEFVKLDAASTRVITKIIEQNDEIIEINKTVTRFITEPRMVYRSKEVRE